MDSPTPERHREVGGDPDVLPPELVHHLRARLLAFYDTHARDLPWRRTGDPYRIWVSEVMLQQTRVDTVIPYYQRWMERFPDVEALAAAELDEVLKLWEGLGYYRRARMLHRAAVRLRDGEGAFPDTADALRELPGVGEYTAGAVASIAFGRREPAVDGNVRRVLARILDLPDPSPGMLRDRAGDLVPPSRPGDFNQAVMELGATVCTPRDPDCAACPVADLCRARERGVQEARPAPRRRSDVPSAEFGVAVPVRSDGGGEGWRVALVRRPLDGMLGGLWEFPSREVDSPGEAASGARRAAEDRGIGVGAPSRVLPAVDHVYSHLRARYRPFLFRVRDGLRPREAPQRGAPPEPEAGTAGRSALRWMDAAALAEAALPRAQRVIAETATDLLGEAGDPPRPTGDGPENPGGPS